MVVIQFEWLRMFDKVFIFMTVKLRFQRHGQKGRPFYHLVAADSKAARDGKFIEKIGYYDPNQEPSQFIFKQDRLEHWFKNGAQMSAQVNTLVKKHKVVLSRT